MIQFAADTPTLAPAGRPAPPPVTGGDASFAALLTPGTLAQAGPGAASAALVAQATTSSAPVGQVATLTSLLGDAATASVLAGKVATPIALVAQVTPPLPAAAPGSSQEVAFGLPTPADPALLSAALIGTEIAATPTATDAIPLAGTPTPAAEVAAPFPRQIAPNGDDAPVSRPIPRRFASAADLTLVAPRAHPADTPETPDRQSDAGNGKDAPASPAPTLALEGQLATLPPSPAIVDAMPTLAASPGYPATAGAAETEAAQPTDGPAHAPSSASLTSLTSLAPPASKISPASPASPAFPPPAASSAAPASLTSPASPASPAQLAPAAPSAAPASLTSPKASGPSTSPESAAISASGAQAAGGSVGTTLAASATVASNPAAPLPTVLPRRREPRPTNDAASHPGLPPPRENGGIAFPTPTAGAPVGTQPIAPAATRPAPIAQPSQNGQPEATTPPSAPTAPAPLATAPVPVPSHWTLAPTAEAQPQTAVPATPTDVAPKPETATPQPQTVAPPRPFEAAGLAAPQPARAAAPTWSRPTPERVEADPAITAPTAAAPLQAPTAVAPAPPAPTLDMRREHWPHDMIGQIERLRDAADAVDTRIRLVPDMLGTVDIDVRREGDTLHVRFQAEQPQTRALLQGAQPRLAEAAESRGLRLGQASVDAGSGNPAGGERDRPHTSTPRQPSRAPSSRAAGPELTDDARIA